MPGNNSRHARAVEDSAAFIAEMFEMYFGQMPAKALSDPYCLGFIQMVGLHVAFQSLGGESGTDNADMAFEESLKLFAPRRAAHIATLLRRFCDAGRQEAVAFLKGRDDGRAYMVWSPPELGRAALRTFTDRFEALETRLPEPAHRRLPGKWQLANRQVFRNYEFAKVTTPGITTSVRMSVRVGRNLNGSMYSRIEFTLCPYLYMWPSQRPLGDQGEMVKSPVGVALWATVEGTDDSPEFLGRSFSVSAMAEKKPDTITLGTDDKFSVNACVQALSSGEDLAFMLYAAETKSDVKLRLALPNDGDFAALFFRLASAI
jgi:hypothetical protein